MGLLDYFRRKSAKGVSEFERRGDYTYGEPESTATFPATDKRPFDTVAEALSAWQDGDSARADRLFKQGIDEYSRHEPDGIAFALGRYGAFLLDQDRKVEAMRILERAIELKTDIPAIWSDYMRLLSERRDIDAFKRGIDLMAAAMKNRIQPEFALAHARRADREGASAFAEAIARWVIDSAAIDGDREGRWAAIGDLGHILENAGRPGEAVSVWQTAFKEGSPDPETAGRLSMHLERSKDYVDTMAVIREALSRGLPANVEESLRKRLARCEARINGKTQPKASKPDVAAYSVRRGTTLFEPIFQVRLKPPVKHLELVDNIARCLLASKESSTLVDIDLVSGLEVRRVDNLPLLGDTCFAPDGRGLGIRRTAAVGQGPTLLRFIGPDGRLTAESAVPDATSEIALGPDLWYVGCRDGCLYAFGFDGKQRWIWETPGSKQYKESPYFRPCPYYVASQRAFAVVASMGNIYAVSPNGKTLWHAALPNEHQTRWEFTVPLSGGGRGNDEPYRILGLPIDASRDQVKSAYRRLALATHPDRNPADGTAADRFRRVQGAYERILAGQTASPAGSGGITVSIEIQGFGPTASFIAANAAGVVVGSSQGRLYVFDANGSLREARALGDGPVRAALRPDGTIGAAWYSDTLLFFKGNRIVNAAGILDWPYGLVMFGDDVVSWRGSEVQLMDADGQMLWAVEFSKSISGVAAHGEALVCAAGVLAAFRRCRNK